MLSRPTAGHLRARFRTVAGLVVLAVVGAVAASTAIQHMVLFSPDMVAAPVTVGAGALAAGAVQCDRTPQLHDFYERAVRSPVAVSWTPRLLLLGTGLILLLPAGHGAAAPYGVGFVLRNVLLFAGWALTVGEIHSRAAGTGLVALWAGTLVVSSSAPAWAAAVWRLPLQPADTPLGWILVAAGWAAVGANSAWRQ